MIGHATAILYLFTLPSLLQLLLLTAVKDVANALGDLIDSTRTASGKSVQDPAMEKLKTSAKVGPFKCGV